MRLSLPPRAPLMTVTSLKGCPGYSRSVQSCPDVALLLADQRQPVDAAQQRLLGGGDRPSVEVGWSVAHEDWVRVALRRLPQAIRRGRYSSIRQLEMKVSEAGPGDLRANPIHLREALNQLGSDGQVLLHHPPSPRGITLPTFYTPPNFSEGMASDVERRDEVLSLYAVFLKAAKDDSGKTLERAVYRAALDARKMERYITVIGSPDRPPDAAVVLNDVPVAEALDLILITPDGIVAVEDKDLREWLSPSSSEVWGVIGKALRHDALPVLICRKVTYDLFLLFKQIGALAFQVHRQHFPTEYAERLARVKHKDGLGFHDLSFGDQPSPGLVRFIGETVPRYLAERLRLFRQHANLLREFAIDSRLESDELPGDQRSHIYRAFFRRLKGWEEEQEGPPDDQWGW